MTLKNLVLERPESGILLIKVSRLAAMNALNTATLIELKETLTQEAENDATRVILLTGDGEKAFIAGADILEMRDKNVEDGVQFAQLGHEVTKLLELMPKPTIAAVNGYAFGGGCEMAIACDFIIASQSAVFSQPEVGLGLIPGFGGTLRLAKFIGLPRAKEMIFSGRRVKADEAFEMGLVNHVYASENFIDQVVQYAQTICTQSASAISGAKRLLNEFSESAGLNFKLDAEARAFGFLFGSIDQQEGITAFIEKRKPIFKGLSS